MSSLPEDTQNRRRLQRRRVLLSGLAIALDHLKFARIPAAFVLLGWYLTFRVDQIHELFVLLVQKDHLDHQLWALGMAFTLGVTVWYALRTAFRFDLPGFESLCSPRGAGLRQWLPRLFGAAVPMLMAIGCISVDTFAAEQSFLARWWIVAAFVTESLLLLGLISARRTILRRFVPDVHSDPNDDPRVTSWSELPTIHRFFRIILAVNILTVLIAAFVPGTIAHMGTPALILFAAIFGTLSGVYLTVSAYRCRIPLLILLVMLAAAFEMLGYNDNHRVRLYPGMTSDRDPDWNQVASGAPLPQSFNAFASAWQRGDAEPIFLVSAEGGGIRAAAWTAMVLANLEVASEGRFSRAMMAGSGVSGGSLGLALFAAMVKAERDGLLELQAFPAVATAFLETDFLAPTVEALMFTESAQALLPIAAFVDRGQRLEMAWERAWRRTLRQYGKPGACDPKRGAVPPACDAFAQPWRELWQSPKVPALFLNATVVESGHRFVQHPFSAIVDGSVPMPVPVPDPVQMHGSISSASLLPGSAPLAAVVHNSARFTYVSPAGRLLFARDNEERDRPGHVQLVDGGYFENSATSTLAEITGLVETFEPQCRGNAISNCRVYFIHISNDPAVPALLGKDSCVVPPEAGATSSAQSLSEPRNRRTPGAIEGNGPLFGGLTTPVFALLNTRDARGEFARRAQQQLLLGKGTDAALFHYRLCKGTHRLPLGWTISHNATVEMQRQLCGEPGVSTPNAAYNRSATSSIVNKLETPGSDTSPTCPAFRTGTSNAE